MTEPITTCEYACPEFTYGSVAFVNPETAADVRSDRWVEKAWTGKSGCQMFAFNDGKELQRNYSKRNHLEITCFGPADERCPKRRGFGLVKETIKGLLYTVARRLEA